MSFAGQRGHGTFPSRSSGRATVKAMHTRSPYRLGREAWTEATKLH